LNDGIEFIDYKGEKLLLLNSMEVLNNDEFIKNQINKYGLIFNKFRTAISFNSERNRNASIHDKVKHIEEFYKPKQLIEGILKLGEIPDNLIENTIGVGFIDIADYSFISKFLSPKENQIVLNGLFNAFNWIIKKYGGYLNKIEGDSLMFQFGCPIDKLIDENNRLYSIAKRLFYSCVEMQKLSSFFNDANDDLIRFEADEVTKDAIEKAFEIIYKVRNDQNTAVSMSAVFQIRIRVGANIGSVSIGNFGPEEYKHWDIIGENVIKAKRMESTAPIGGLRISEEFYKLLYEFGITDEYYKEFIREAKKINGYYRNIKPVELFKSSEIIIKDKKNVTFKTYSVQVLSDLPEKIAEQVKVLLFKDIFGINKIIEFLQYYRGNQYVIDAIEETFNRLSVNVRKEKIFKLLNKNKYNEILLKFNYENLKALQFIREKCSLFSFFRYLGIMQDELKHAKGPEETESEFVDFNDYMRKKYKYNFEKYKFIEKISRKKAYFFNVLFTLIFENIKASLFEFQKRYQ